MTVTNVIGVSTYYIFNIISNNFFKFQTVTWAKLGQGQV